MTMVCEPVVDVPEDDSLTAEVVEVDSKVAPECDLVRKGHA